MKLLTIYFVFGLLCLAWDLLQSTRKKRAQ
jgi:hypothetical protein